MLDVRHNVRDDSVGYVMRELQSFGRGYYPDIAHEPAELMQRFEFQMDINALPPWVNPYRAAVNAFKAENQNMLIQDVKIAENTLHMRFYILILARPKKEEDIYREQLDRLLYEQ